MSKIQALHTILRSLAPYRIDENNITLTQTVLGRGGFGVVLLGEMGRSVAVPEGGMLVAVKQLQATGTVSENENLALAELDEAIDLFRQSLLLRPRGHPDRQTTLHYLAISLGDKYRERGNVMDLDAAIDTYRQVLEFRPHGHPERHNALSNLALALLDKYRKQGNIADLDEAIGLLRQVLLLRSEGHPERNVTLNSLVGSLFDRYDKRGDAEDLDEALALYQQTLSLVAVYDQGSTGIRAGWNER